ncbi:MAG: hypothetical protein ACREVH_07455 [Gammaproteobacteria bacterium]
MDMFKSKSAPTYVQADRFERYCNVYPECRSSRKTFMRRNVSVFTGIALAFVFGFLGTSEAVFAHDGNYDPNLIHACVKARGSRVVTILKPTAKSCKRKKGRPGMGRPVHWSTTGLQGVQGLAGPVGPQGPAGAPGTDGQDGATGPQGIQGLAGPAGPQGPAGAPGTDGQDGATGATGATGPQGVQGLAGPVGPQGPAGASGLPGASLLSSNYIFNYQNDNQGNNIKHDKVVYDAIPSTISMKMVVTKFDEDGEVSRSLLSDGNPFNISFLVDDLAHNGPVSVDFIYADLTDLANGVHGVWTSLGCTTVTGNGDGNVQLEKVLLDKPTVGAYMLSYTITPGEACPDTVNAINPLGAALGAISVLPALPVELDVDTDGDGVADHADSDPLVAQ